jgi:Pyruvate/2-oxoacid:ferredoxin oxidoreductase gamma subunit
MTARTVMFTGIGGQGVQIISKTLATAAVNEGRGVLLVPRYGGIMRGGKTNAELTVGDGRLEAVPVVSDAWAGLVMDQAYWRSIEHNLAEHAVLLVNANLFHLDVPGAEIYRIPAVDLATELGSPMSASMVMLGAFVALTHLVRPESIAEAMRKLVPPYRSQHIAANELALRAGAEAVPNLAAPAWPTVLGR